MLKKISLDSISMSSISILSSILNILSSAYIVRTYGLEQLGNYLLCISILTIIERVFSITSWQKIVINFKNTNKCYSLACTLRVDILLAFLSSFVSIIIFLLYFIYYLKIEINILFFIPILLILICNSNGFSYGIVYANNSVKIINASTLASIISKIIIFIIICENKFNSIYLIYGNAMEYIIIYIIYNLYSYKLLKDDDIHILNLLTIKNSYSNLIEYMRDGFYFGYIGNMKVFTKEIITQIIGISFGTSFVTIFNISVSFNNSIARCTDTFKKSLYVNFSKMHSNQVLQISKRLNSDLKFLIFILFLITIILFEIFGEWILVFIYGLSGYEIYNFQKYFLPAYLISILSLYTPFFSYFEKNNVIFKIELFSSFLLILTISTTIYYFNSFSIILGYLIYNICHQILGTYHISKLHSQLKYHE